LVDRAGAFAWPMLGSSAGKTMFDIRRRELIALLGSSAPRCPGRSPRTHSNPTGSGASAF
jgi:hypothetical protein